MKCSVGIVVLRCLLQALLVDADWIWQNYTETEKRCSNLRKSLHIQMLLCFVLILSPQLNRWTITFPTNLCLMKNVWLHNNQLISMFPTGQPKQYTDTLLPDSLHIIYLQFLLLIIILFLLFNIFLQVVIRCKPKHDGETRRTAVFH